MERYAVVSYGADEYVSGVDRVRHLCGDLIAVVCEGDSYVDGFLGERYIVGGVEGLAYLCSLVILQPLLEESGEGPCVDDLL